MDYQDMTLSSATIAVAVVLLTVIYYWIKKRGIVPGPRGIPYLGLYPFLTDENANMKLAEYKKQYGDIFSFTYTGRLYINLGSIKAMREVQVNKSDCFAGRFKDTNVLVEMLNNGVTFVNGEPWKVLRKFFIQRFKEYGLNTVRESLAGPVYDTLNATVEDLKNSKDTPINIVDFLGQHCAVTMRKIVFGEKGVTDEELGNIITSYGNALEGNGGVNLLLIGPLARFLFSVKPSFRKNFKNHRLMSKIILGCAKKIESSMNDEQPPTCVIEEFFRERNERRRNKDPTWEYFTDEALVESVLQFVGDGIMGIAAFIAGLLNALMDYPEEQEKLYSEIAEVIGPNRQPTAEDRSNLPYVNAFMNEYIRTSIFLKFFPSLECTKETVVRGYRVPVGSITLLNFWSAHHDPETYEDPDKFTPSRYMPSPDKPKAESPVTFGMGKRSCSGEPFVMLQTFLFLTTIVKNFKIVSSNAPPLNSFDFFVTGKLELTFVPRTES